MPKFIGFNTIGQNKKFTLTDFELIKRDLSNSLNIQLGSLPGRPGYGTLMWSYVFEPQSPETVQGITKELQRVAGGDPRLYISQVEVFPQQNGILIQLQIQIVGSTTAERLAIFFNQLTRVASFV